MNLTSLGQLYLKLWFKILARYFELLDVLVKKYLDSDCTAVPAAPMLFALLALWSLWDIAAHSGIVHGLSGADPAFYQLPLMTLLLTGIFAVNHYRISKQSAPKTEKGLVWYIRWRFYAVLKVAIGYSIIVGLLSAVLPLIFPVITLVVGAAAAVYWDKLRLVLYPSRARG